MSYDNTNKGALFKNLAKRSDKSPDYTGSVNVEGVEYFFSGWIKISGPNSQNPGTQFLSVSVDKKKEQKAIAPPPSFDDLGDDIPF